LHKKNFSKRHCTGQFLGNGIRQEIWPVQRRTGNETSFNQIIGMLNKHLGTNIKPTYLENPIKNYVYRTLADISLATGIGLQAKMEFGQRCKAASQIV
jgi:hypothetical protein